MGFRDDYEAAAEDLEDYFADGTIDYSDPGGTSAANVPATIHKPRKERRKNNAGGFDWVTVRTVCLFDHTTPTVSSPRRDATVTIGSDTYSVLEISTPSPGRIHLKLQQTRAAEVTRERYRGM